VLGGKPVPEQLVANVRRDGGNDHPAVRAWRTLHPASSEPETIMIVNQGKHFAVYRLGGAVADGSAVIAKQRPPADLAVERMVYQDVLPHLPLPLLRCHGYLEEDDRGIGWLFIEDAGREDYSPQVGQHGTFAGQWLGLVHTAAACAAAPAGLPQLESDHYREQLVAAHDMVLRTLASPALQTADRAILRTAADQCAFLASRWDQVVAVCNCVPRTLVHGDLATKNVRLRRSRTGTDLVAFDWEMAGWGIPAIDLAQDTLHSVSPDLSAYWSVVRHAWPHLDREDIRRLADLGGVFRLLVAMSWARRAYRTSEWAGGAMREFRRYYVDISNAIGEIRRWS
jgi:aminoglycoside phosphotransferase (APT) family kinase protein